MLKLIDILNPLITNRCPNPARQTVPLLDVTARPVSALEGCAERVKAAGAAYAALPLEARQARLELEGLVDQAQAATEALRQLIDEAAQSANQLPQIH